MKRGFTIDDYPRKASHDEDSALRALIAQQLARQVYRPAGAPALSAQVYDGAVAPPPGVVVIHEEWAEGEAQATFPALAILPAEGVYENARFAPGLDESTAWPPESEPATERIVLHVESEYVVTFDIQALTNDRVMRRALIRGARAALSGSMDWSPAAEERYGILLDSGDLYFGEKARITPLRSGNQDNPEAAAKRLKFGTLSVRAAIRVVEPVIVPVLLDTRYEDPLPGDVEDGLRGIEVGV